MPLRPLRRAAGGRSVALVVVLAMLTLALSAAGPATSGVNGFAVACSKVMTTNTAPYPIDGIHRRDQHPVLGRHLAGRHQERRCRRSPRGRHAQRHAGLRPIRDIRRSDGPIRSRGLERRDGGLLALPVADVQGGGDRLRLLVGRRAVVHRRGRPAERLHHGLHVLRRPERRGLLDRRHRVLLHLEFVHQLHYGPIGHRARCLHGERDDAHLPAHAHDRRQQRHRHAVLRPAGQGLHDRRPRAPTAVRLLH